MAKISIILDNKRTDSQGRHAVKILLTNNKTNTSISTGVFVFDKDFIGEPYQAVSKKVPAAKISNEKIAGLYNMYYTALSLLTNDGRVDYMTSAEIRKYAENKDSKNSSFTQFANKHVQNVKNKGTRYIYDYAVRLMHDFYNKPEISFKDIDTKHLVAFDDFLCNKGIGTNTRSIIMRSIRCICNKAIDAELINIDWYPFRKFKIKEKAKEKEFLMVDTIRLIMSLDLSGGEAMARDFFVLSFFFCGVNPIDLFNMPIPINKKVSFVRTKIAHKEPQPLHITIQPEAEMIIERYKGKQHMLCFSEEYATYLSFKRFMCKCLQRIGDKLGIHLYFYLARYSWATYADKLDVPERVIGKALGHTGTSLADKRYISFDWSKVDEANRKVIDYVVQDKNIPS